jgi:hypothetical protein
MSDCLVGWFLFIRDRASTKDDRRADHALEVWAQKNGYEKVKRLGGAWPGGKEAELSVESVADAVVNESQGSITEAEVLKAFREGSRQWEPTDEMVYWGSSDGDITMYAKPKEDVTGKHIKKKSNVSQLKNKLLR